MNQIVDSNFRRRKLQETPSTKTSLVDVSEILSTRSQLPCRIFFKFELEQPSKSFKLRGIGHLIQKSIRRGEKRGKFKSHVVASSGGNAGLAAAYSANFYGVECTVVVPMATMIDVIKKLQDLGATIIIHGKTIDEASQYAKNLLHRFDSSVNVIYCHPFDNRLIWEGHSKIVDEIFDQLSLKESDQLKGVVCSVGGGGLYNGIIEGLKRNGSKADCLLLETKQAPTMSSSVKEGSVIELNSVKSIATSLACSYVPKAVLDNFLHCNTNKSHIRAIDDTEAVRGCLRFYDDFGKCIEPACGTAVSAVYNQLDYLKVCIPQLKKEDVIVVIVCGGSCVNEKSLQMFRKVLRQDRL